MLERLRFFENSAKETTNKQEHKQTNFKNKTFKRTKQVIFTGVEHKKVPK